MLRSLEDSERASLRKDVSPEAPGTLEIRLYRSETGSDVHKPSTPPFFEVESWRDLRGLQGTANTEPIHEIQSETLYLITVVACTDIFKIRSRNKGRNLRTEPSRSQNEASAIGQQSLAFLQVLLSFS